ncbi:hypothetical protein MRX96_030512 [Rhipicephalus microplus]
MQLNQRPQRHQSMHACRPTRVHVAKEKDTEQWTAPIHTHAQKMKKQHLCDVAKRKAHHKASLGSPSQRRVGE